MGRLSKEDFDFVIKKILNDLGTGEDADFQGMSMDFKDLAKEIEEHDPALAALYVRVSEETDKIVTHLKTFYKKDDGKLRTIN